MANTFARMLRQNTTDAERILWASLRDLKRIGFHFRRQVPFAKYVADFCCHSAKLVVELDGDQHGADAAAAYDAERTDYLSSRGYRVLRFANWEVMRERDRRHCACGPIPPPEICSRKFRPPRKGEVKVLVWRIFPVGRMTGVGPTLTIRNRSRKR